MDGLPPLFFGGVGKFSARFSYTPGDVIFSSLVAGLVFLSVIFQSFVAQSFQRITGSLPLGVHQCIVFVEFSIEDLQALLPQVVGND